VLIPQLLFSGTVIDFSKLHKAVISEKYVPIIGDIMTSRWAYEALMVVQFKNNKYEREFFQADKDYYNAVYNASIYYDKLEELLHFLYNNRNNPEKIALFKMKYRILKNELTDLSQKLNNQCPYLDSLQSLTSRSLNAISDYLYYNLKKPNQLKQRQARLRRDSIYYVLLKKLGSDSAIVQLKLQNHNNRVEDYVTNKIFDFSGIKEGKDCLIRIYYPIFHIPDNKYGRAHFYASYKRIGNLLIDTFWFNSMVIFSFSVLLYIVLIFRLLEKDRLFKTLMLQD